MDSEDGVSTFCTMKAGMAHKREKFGHKWCSLSISGLLTNYLIRSGALQDLEVLARIAEPLAHSTTATGKSSSKGEGKIYGIQLFSK